MSKSSSRAGEPTVVIDTDLSRAWSSIFLRILDGRGSEVSPLVLSLSGFDDESRLSETTSVRHALDQILTQKRKISVEDVAYTIFPERLWQIAGRDRARLFELYKGVYPRYVAMNRRANGRGLYFERLTMFGDDVPCDGNQLEWICLNTIRVLEFAIQCSKRQCLILHAITSRMRASVFHACSMLVSCQPAMV